jgi:hypothetical protein
MKNLVEFHGSCGHVTIEEVDDETWLRLATIPGHGPLGPEPTPCEFKIIDENTRIVFVYPLRYCECIDCMRKTMEDEIEYYAKHS